MLLSKRNEGQFNQDNIQWVYSKICKEFFKYQSDNFLFPAAKPNYNIYGWTHNMERTLYPTENEKDVEKLVEILETMKSMNMISHTEIHGLKICYHKMSNWSHCVEIIIEFADPVIYIR